MNNLIILLLSLGLSSCIGKGRLSVSKGIIEEGDWSKDLCYYYEDNDPEVSFKMLPLEHVKKALALPEQVTYNDCVIHTIGRAICLMGNSLKKGFEGLSVSAIANIKIDHNFINEYQKELRINIRKKNNTYANILINTLKQVFFKNGVGFSNKSCGPLTKIFMENTINDNSNKLYELNLIENNNFEIIKNKISRIIELKRRSVPASFLAYYDSHKKQHFHAMNIIGFGLNRKTEEIQDFIVMNSWTLKNNFFGRFSLARIKGCMDINGKYQILHIGTERKGFDVKPGLNIRGRCLKCKNMVLSNLGYNSMENKKFYFDILWLLDEVHCPMCSTLLDEESIDKLIVYKSKYLFEGKLNDNTVHCFTDPSGVFEEFSFRDEDGEMLWKSLRISVHKV